MRGFNLHTIQFVSASSPSVLIIFMLFPSCMENKSTPPSLPESLLSDTVFEKFGIKRSDPYYRLRERDNPLVLQHLKNENDYTSRQMAPLQQLRDKILDELVARIPPEDEMYPTYYKGWYYGYYYQAGKEYPIHYRSRDQNATEKQVFLDENELAKEKPYCDVAAIEFSPDERYLAYAVDYVGNRCYSIYVKDLNSGQVREEVPNISEGGLVWTADSRAFLYVEKDPQTLRPYKVRCHRVGTPQRDDALLYTEEDETFSCGVSKTTDEKFLLIECASTESSEVLYAPAAGVLQFKPIIPRTKGHLYDVDFHENRWIICTNYQAPNFRIVALPFGKNSPQDFKEIVPQQPYLIEDFALTRFWLAWTGISQGSCDLYCTSWKELKPQKIDMGGAPHSVELHGNLDYNVPYVRFSYNDLRTIPMLYDVEPGKPPVFRFRRKVNFHYDEDKYHTLLLQAPARDGAHIPISLVYRKDMFKRRKNPLLLYGYGSYGISLLPNFSSSRLSLLDRGFVLAYAHVRGGQDNGRAWYDSGRLLFKKNTFYDFIDCAEFLKLQGWCAADKIMAMGGSAGGMLMGAVLNMRPDLWAAVVAEVPFVDVVTTMLDETIPLTTAEYDEWGNPNDPKYFKYMLSYSPYDNVPHAAFPPVLVLTALHDSQVQYWEPAKWVLRLRERNTGPNPILLHCEMEAGHGGKTGRYSALEEVALIYTFLLHWAGINQ
ncbi:MAG: S9 family peptidase [Flavobacteriales bacterium]|nr:S9 family peptidase [Flavobacteriales bacterium]